MRPRGLVVLADAQGWEMRGSAAYLRTDRWKDGKGQARLVGLTDRRLGGLVLVKIFGQLSGSCFLLMDAPSPWHRRKSSRDE